MTKKTPAPTTKSPSLPPDVTENDTMYSAAGPSLSIDQLKKIGEENGTDWHDVQTLLVFYRTEGRNKFGWVLTTLPISGGKPPRTYGITVGDEKIVTVGRGPHVTDTVTVYVTADNIGRLRKYVDLYKKGMAEAGSVRDRISSRRAQGQVHRANGRTSWMW